MKAVIIDDEFDICLLLTAILKSHGIISSFTSTLKEGLQKITSEQPHLIFLDINLPDGSGLDALPLIKKKHPDSRIIIISAYDGEAERHAALENGASGFMGKPFSNFKVESTLRALN
jgi:two-component system OmpR family response regulator